MTVERKHFMCRKNVEQEKLKTIYLPCVPAEKVNKMVTLIHVCETHFSGILYEINYIETMSNHDQVSAN